MGTIFKWLILGLCVLPQMAYASRDSTSADTTVVAPFTAASKTWKLFLVRPGAQLQAQGAIHVDSLVARGGDAVMIGDWTIPAGARWDLSHLRADSLSTDSLTVLGPGYISGAFNVGGATTLDGNVTIGNATGDALTFHPAAWTLTNAVTVTGTWTNLGTVTTVDINGGTVDGAIIGGASAAAGTFTTLKGDSLNIAGDLIVAPTQNYVMTASGVSLSVGGDVTPNGKLHVVGPGGAASGAAYAANATMVLEDGANNLTLQFAHPSGATASAQILFGDADNDAGEIEYSHLFDRLSLYAGAKGVRLEMRRTVEIANGDSLSLTDNFFSNASPNGELLILEANGGVFGMFFIQAADVQEMLDYENRTSAAKGTSTSANVYWSSVASKHYLENLRGIAQTYTLIYRGY